MLKTNSKRVIEKVQSYIIDCAKAGLHQYLEHEIDEYDYNLHPMQCCMMLLQQEAWFEYKNFGYSTAFDYWQRGLCSALPCYAYNISYYQQRNLLKNWLEETDDEANKYDDEKVERLFLNLIKREFLKMYERELKQSQMDMIVKSEDLKGIESLSCIGNEDGQQIFRINKKECGILILADSDYVRYCDSSCDENGRLENNLNNRRCYSSFPFSRRIFEKWLKNKISNGNCLTNED